MKIYIVTADDIEDAYPEAAFSTHKFAEEYLMKKNGGPLTPHTYMSRPYAETYSLIVELELNSGKQLPGKYLGKEEVLDLSKSTKQKLREGKIKGNVGAWGELETLYPLVSQLEDYIKYHECPETKDD